MVANRMSTASHEGAPYRGARAELTAAAPLASPAASADGSKAAAVISWVVARLKRFWRQTSSWLCSLIIHALLIILLGWAVTSPRGRGEGANLLASFDAVDRVNELSAATIDTAERADAVEQATPDVIEETSTELARNIQADAPLAAASVDLGQSPTPTLDFGELMSLPGGGLGEVGDLNVDVRGALGGRGAAARARLAQEGGATPDSEAAVKYGLRWLQAHQSPNGSWHFDLKLSPCQGLCGDSGTEPSTTAATGLALLAFLGHGDTHFEGDYQDTVKRGLYYLTSQMHITKQGGDLRDQGRMYAQGIATIALCEAYAMTQDRALEPFAQQAIDYIVNAQHKQGGGWRYMPGEPGDTTVTGWQLMALKSGQMAYLRVPLDTLRNATRFLDSVQFDQGSRYKYQPRVKHGEETTNTAIGLLCRMYTGWQRDNPALERGVGQLSGEGPAMLGPNADMYYNYYATQIMHQWGGEIWTLWNNRLRDFLVQTQSHDGHESGSWNFHGGQAARGGRLYNTAMAIMTLEVYYRHMPLYREEGIGDRE